MFAAGIRLKRVHYMRQFPHWRWHLEEMYVKKTVRAIVNFEMTAEL
jgi:hypothetical protein